MRLHKKTKSLFVPRPAHEFSRIILVINPQSSNIHRLKSRAEELARVYPDTVIEIVETLPEQVQFQEKLQKILSTIDKQTLLGIGGGDGTTNMVVNVLYNATPQLDLRKIVLLPLWGGNANDLAYMLNGLPSRIKLKTLFAKARIIAFYPLKVQISDRSEKITVRYAASYASFGATAYTAKQLAKPVSSKRIAGKALSKTIISESRRAMLALLDAPGYDAEQDGRKIKMFEQLFSNGSRMAKYDHLPTQLTEKQFYYAVRSDTPPTFYFYILWMMRGKKMGEIRQRPVEFTTRERTWAQFDGETTAISEHTIITVGHSTRALYALSTKLS